MGTPNLNLPLITDNMSGDVPRDMNALANTIDSSVPSLGKDNTSINLVKAVDHAIDTRTLETVRDVNKKIQTVNSRDGATVIKTISVTRGTSGRIQSIASTAGGKTVTLTVNRDADGKISTLPKVVN